MKPFVPMTFVRIAAALAALPFAACVTLGPDYQKPDTAVPVAYSQAGRGRRGARRLVEAVRRSGARPAGGGGARRQPGPGRGRGAGGGGAGVRRSGSRRPIPRGHGAGRRLAHQVLGRRWSVPAPARDPAGVRLRSGRRRTSPYELDFWGRYRRASEAARADLLATEDGRLNVRLAVAAEVATAYFDLLALDSQLAVSRDTAGSRGESVQAPEPALRRRHHLGARPRPGPVRAGRGRGHDPGARALDPPDREPAGGAPRPLRRHRAARGEPRSAGRAARCRSACRRGSSSAGPTCSPPSSG